MCRAERRGRAAAGFTLVEMLVTLVLVAAVSSLLAQALALTARLEQSLARAHDDGQQLELRAAWLRAALQALVVPPGAEQGLRGSATRLDAITTAPPWPGSSGPEAFALELRPDAGAGVDGGAGDGPGAAGRLPGLRLWALRPATGETFDLGVHASASRFEYLDAQGRWSPAWPPQPPDPGPEAAQRPLPRALRLLDLESEDAPAAAAGLTLVAPQATRNPMLGRAQARPADDAR